VERHGVDAVHRVAAGDDLKPFDPQRGREGLGGARLLLHDQDERRIERTHYF